MKTKKLSKRIIAYIPSLIMLGIIFGFSSQNGASSGHLSAVLFDYCDHFLHLPISRDIGIIIIRKAAHMSEFALLTLTLDYALYQNDHQHIRLKALLLCLLFACLDEWHQTFVAGRTGLLTDVIIDTSGGLLTQMIYTIKKH